MSQLFIDKYIELLKEGRVEKADIFTATVDALELEGVDVTKKSDDKAHFVPYFQ